MKKGLLCIVIALGIILNLCLFGFVGYKAVGFAFNKVSESIKSWMFPYKYKFIEVMTANETAEMKDIFDFEFDYAYVLHNPYEPEEHLIERLELSGTEVHIMTFERDGLLRILFIKDNVAVEDFVFDASELYTDDYDTKVYPDTVIVRESTSEPLTFSLVLEE